MMDENIDEEEVNMISSKPVFKTAEISLKEKIHDALANPKSGHNQRFIIILVTSFVTMMMFLSNILSVMTSNKKPVMTIDAPQTALTKQMLFTDYSMAKAQSYGFFYDIRLEEWELMRQRMRYERMNLQKRLTSELQPNLIYGQPSNSWYQHNYEQDFSCKHERKIGGIGEGAKWVCDPHRIPRSQSTYEHIVLNGPRNRNTEESPSRCLVYSIGNKGNFQFEFGLQDLIGKKVCEIHIFDSPEYIESYKKLTGLQDDNVFFHPWMLKGSQELSIQGDYKTFQDTVQILGHRDRVIDILKIDCEGCEWDTYKDWLYTKVTIMQILVQLHGSPRHPHDFFHKLHYHNYVTFHKEPSTLFKGGEYSFLKLAPEFFT